MKLINSKTNQEIKVGDEVITFRGEKGKLIGIKAPQHSGSTGRVYVEIKKRENSFFPSVIGAKFVDDCYVPRPVRFEE